MANERSQAEPSSEDGRQGVLEIIRRNAAKAEAELTAKIQAREAAKQDALTENKQTSARDDAVQPREVSGEPEAAELPIRDKATKRAADIALEGSPPPKRTTRRRGPRKLPLPLYKAHVKTLAETCSIRVTGATSDVDDAIIQRIKKCHDLEQHPSTSKAEAKAALFMATRLQAQYNVSLADVLAHEPASAQRQYAGQSIVSLHRVDGDKFKRVLDQSFMNELCYAMEDFFDCKYYTTSCTWFLEVTFYGIAENTMTAARSFEMVYNLIVEWARSQKGGAVRNSYCLGICDELQRMAKKEKAEEEAQAKEAESKAISTRVEQEEAERQAQLDRLAPWPYSFNARCSPEPAARPGTFNGDDGENDASQDDNCIWISSDSESMGDDDFENDEENEAYVEPDFIVIDDDDSDVNTFEDVEDEINKLVKPERKSTETPRDLHSLPPYLPNSTINMSASSQHSAPELHNSAERQEPAPELRWASHMQLITFRANATNIADEFLQDQGVKLSKKTGRESVIRDWDAYDKGVKDSKKIDVRRKQIEEGAPEDSEEHTKSVEDGSTGRDT